ncbi:MAG: diaminopimelate decarboxylase [Desulfobacteraceae bacterium]|nr:MAG: diaminopimelate decarboxylase [Desulfobacteraceae bacterium]
MHHFEYRNDSLHCEDVPVAHIARAVGTPLYLYSQATLERHFKAFQEAFAGAAPLVCYSAKANSSLAVLTLFRKWGSGLDIVSGGELFRGLKAGFEPRTIVYSGVGKRVDEIDAAIGHDILMFNIESMEELALINQRAGALNRRARIAIRINPDVDPQTHPYIATGLKKTKFGIDLATALAGYREARRMPNVEIAGIACHLGSQITSLGPFREAVTGLIQIFRELQALEIPVTYLDMGGGVGITYHEESPPRLDAYADTLIDAVDGTGLRLILEPGRVLVGNAGILVTRVLYRKQGKDKIFIVVDAGMNDLMRPALYQAYHAVQPVEQSARENIVADVVGPICESSDFLARDRSMPDACRDELLAVMGAGAYCFAMSSTYCSRPRVAEVMVYGDQFDVIRRPEDMQDLVRGEQLPHWLTKPSDPW